MKTSAGILRIVRKAFSACPRPNHFTDYTHCDDCADHDAVLRSRTVDTIRREDAGTVGYDPFGFASVEGYKYYFPALAKMAFDPNPNEEWFGGQLIFHLTNNGKQNRFLNAFDNEQRKAVVASLLHLQNSVELEKEPWLKEELVEAIELWSA